MMMMMIIRYMLGEILNTLCSVLEQILNRKIAFKKCINVFIANKQNAFQLAKAHILNK